MAISDATQTTFSWDGGAVAEVVSVTPPSVSVAAIAQPKLGGNHKEFRASSKYEPGEITVTFYCPEGDAFFADAIGDQSTPKAWVVTADDFSFSGTGIITEYTPAEHAEDADATASVTIKVTSEITYS
jgi:hypothetical protein